MNDEIVRAITVSGGIRVLVCAVSGLAREICRLQQASHTVSVALGRALAGVSLMGALLKPGQRVALKFEGNGPVAKIIVEADNDGAVRGCVGNPAAEVEPVAGKWNVAGVLGRAGFLTVSKDLGIGGEPYRGMVQLTTSEIGDDLAYYLTDSEQIPSAVGVGTAIDEMGLVEVCCGFLIQALPGADAAEIEQILERISVIPPLTNLLQQNGPQGIIAALLGDIPFAMLERHELFFRCGCSREKVESALVSIGVAALHEMREKEHGADVTCEFCRQSYHFDSDDLQSLADRLNKTGGV